MRLSIPIREPGVSPLSQLLSYADASASGMAHSLGVPPAAAVALRPSPAIVGLGSPSIHITLEIADGSGRALSIHVGGPIAEGLIERAREIAHRDGQAPAMPDRQCRALGELIARCSELEIAAVDGDDAAASACIDVDAEQRRRRPPGSARAEDSSAAEGDDAEACTEKREPAPLPKWRLKRAVEYIDSHLDDNISLADVASAAGLSRMHFARQFRRATSMPPREYLLRRRITRSQELLRHSDARLVDIALSVGFLSQAHFTTVFKRFSGTTPHQWRWENRAPVV
jgi:AraC-like DNA-binding protein